MMTGLDLDRYPSPNLAVIRLKQTPKHFLL